MEYLGKEVERKTVSGNELALGRRKEPKGEVMGSGQRGECMM